MPRVKKFQTTRSHDFDELATLKSLDRRNLLPYNGCFVVGKFSS